MYTNHHEHTADGKRSEIGARNHGESYRQHKKESTNELGHIVLHVCLLSCRMKRRANKNRALLSWKHVRIDAPVPRLEIFRFDFPPLDLDVISLAEEQLSRTPA